MASDPVGDTRRAEYQQQRKVDLLRNRLYAQPDPTASSELMEALRQAEAELRRLALERQAAEKEAGRAVLLETSIRKEPPGGTLLGPETTGIDVKVSQRLSHVPTGIAHLLDPQQAPLVGYEISVTGRDYARVRVSSVVEGYSAPAIDTVEVFAEKPAELSQLPIFFPAALQAVTEMTHATLRVRVDDLDATTEQESTFPVWLLARTSVIFGVEDPATGKWVNLSPYFAAYVTPNVPDVMLLLREAADLTSGKQIIGYQSDAAAVEDQVRAIYQALRARGLVYINSVLAFGATQGQGIQRVRLPRESLATRSANCIDGTVLMASVLEAATLNPGIVLVPGHAFLAWQKGAAPDSEWDFVETTMLGQSDFDAAHQTGTGEAKYWQAQAAASQDATYYYSLVSLADARARMGILPLE